MCLYRSIKTAELTKEMRAANATNEIVCYKIMSKTALDGVFLSLFQNRMMTLGVKYTSNRSSKKLSKKEQLRSGRPIATIDHGIHVFLNIPYPNSVNCFELGNNILVKCIGLKKDLVAVGLDSEAVFMEVLPIEVVK